MSATAAKALHVLFKLAGADYALPAADVLHMETFSPPTPVPGAADHVAGVLQIRRRVVPIIDLRLRFGLPRIEPTLDSRVIVVGAGARTVGLLVDSAREVLNLAPDQVAAPPDVVARRSRGFVRSVAQAGERLILMIDAHKVIGDEELHGERG